jgi:hypothetical protein
MTAEGRAMRGTLLVVLALSAVAVARAADDDPEPPGKGGAELRKLKGKWTLVRRIINTREVKASDGATYEFSGDKVTVTAPSSNYVARVKAEVKDKLLVLHLSRENSKLTTRMACKIEKGELYLISLPLKGDVKQGDVFRGTIRPVMILTGEKKKE